MKKIALAVSCLYFSSFIHAAPIEKRNLSTPNGVQQDLPAAASQQSLQFWELKQQVQQLQNQVRQLLGKIEEQENQISQLTNDLENRYNDLDQRFEILQQQNSEAEPTDASEESSDKEANPPPEETIKAEAKDQQDYNFAYDAYKQGGAAKAIAPMQKFIDDHPNSSYVSHAYYWLGEFNLSLTPANYHEAKESFEITVGNYPNSTKAPAALYRLIEITQNIDKDINTARQHYQKLIQKYPNSAEAKRAKTSIKL